MKQFTLSIALLFFSHLASSESSHFTYIEGGFSKLALLDEGYPDVKFKGIVFHGGFGFDNGLFLRGNITSESKDYSDFDFTLTLREINAGLGYRFHFSQLAIYGLVEVGNIDLLVDEDDNNNYYDDKTDYASTRNLIVGFKFDVNSLIDLSLELGKKRYNYDSFYDSNKSYNMTKGAIHFNFNPHHSIGLTYTKLKNYSNQNQLTYRYQF